MKIDFEQKLNNQFRFDANHPVTGRFHATRKGIGFVQPDEDPEGDDIYIEKEDTLGALDGDLVKVKVVQDGFSVKNVVEEVLEHHYTEVVGVVTEEKKKTFVVPNNTKLPAIKIGKKHVGEAKPDDMVVAKFSTYGDGTTAPTGAITEIIGNKDAAGVDISAIVREMQIPTEFTDEQNQQAAEIEQKAKAAAENETAEKREDLRSLCLVTVDEPGTKDIDDAISLTKENDGWTLGVHIADASHFVKEDTPLDQEARKRGTSVYLPDRIVPMLPTILSTGVCSLNAGEDRPAMSAILKFNSDGEMTEYRLTPSLIQVRANLNYQEVQALFDREDGKTSDADTADQADAIDDEVAVMLLEMRKLSDKIHEQRHQRGEVEFDLPEAKVILDEQGVPVEIRAEHENDASRMISEFMVSANEAVARSFAENDLPCIYRVHEQPDAESSEALVNLITNAGGEISKEGESITAPEIQAALEKAKGKDYENLLIFASLRTMNRAHYDVECKGHFGLASPYYCHFTSPIRRYPDLIVHRMIHENLDGTLTDERKTYYKDLLGELGQHCSEMEHRSIMCERSATDYKKDQYLGMHIGEEAEGIISGVTKWGIYVELPDTCEGLVPVKSLSDDFYNYEEENERLVGENTGRTLRLGDSVKIRIADVDLRDRTVDFELI